MSHQRGLFTDSAPFCFSHFSPVNLACLHLAKVSIVTTHITKFVSPEVICCLLEPQIWNCRINLEGDRFSRSEVAYSITQCVRVTPLSLLMRVLLRWNYYGPPSTLSLSVMRSPRYVEVSLMVRSLLERNLFCVGFKVFYPLTMQRASTLRVVWWRTWTSRCWWRWVRNRILMFDVLCTWWRGRIMIGMLEVFCLTMLGWGSSCEGWYVGVSRKSLKDWKVVSLNIHRSATVVL